MHASVRACVCAHGPLYLNALEEQCRISFPEKCPLVMVLQQVGGEKKKKRKENGKTRGRHEYKLFVSLNVRAGASD